MDGSHSKDAIPLEPEGNRRFSDMNIAVHAGQPYSIFRG